MTAKECKRFDGCSAPLCPMDESSLNCGIWYPDEEICSIREFGRLDWIKNQKKIARKVRNKDFYFTSEMLSRNCVITVATEGLDPDKNDFNDDWAIKRWLAKHPGKKGISEEKREELAIKMNKVREMKDSAKQGDNCKIKDQTVQ